MKTATAIRLTNADVESMPDDGNRYELIDGELYASAAPSAFHQIVLTNLIFAFRDYLREHPIGRIAPRRGSDLRRLQRRHSRSCFRNHRENDQGTDQDGRFRTAPEIVIEILSPGASNIRRDRHVKLSLYNARGGAEYWIVDPKNRRVAESH